MPTPPPRSLERKTNCSLVITVPGPGFHGFLRTVGDLYLEEIRKLKELPKDTWGTELDKQLENVIALNLAMNAFGPDQDVFAVHYECEGVKNEP